MSGIGNDAPDGDRNNALKYLATRPLPPRMREGCASVHSQINPNAPDRSGLSFGVAALFWPQAYETTLILRRNKFCEDKAHSATIMSSQEDLVQTAAATA
jgi:hypothetical protein